MNNIIRQAIVFLIGLVIELAIPLFLSEQNQKRLVRALGLVIIFISLVWFGSELVTSSPSLLPITFGEPKQPTPLTVHLNNSYNGAVADGEVRDYTFQTTSNVLTELKIQRTGDSSLILLSVLNSTYQTIDETGWYNYIIQPNTRTIILATEPNKEYIIRVQPTSNIKKGLSDTEGGSYILSISEASD